MISFVSSASLAHHSPLNRSFIKRSIASVVLLVALFVNGAANAQELELGNYLNLTALTENQHVMLEQVGELNSLNLLIQANNARVDIFQQGNQNLVAGINGAPEFVMAGANSVVDIVQIGSQNQVFGMQLSANSSLLVTQIGSHNVATIIQR